MPETNFRKEETPCCLELAPEDGHDVVMELDHDTYPRMAYADRKGLDLEGNVFCGQLKTLCMDVQFLTEHSSAGDLVVYIAGRDGGHLPMLSRMFPSVRFDVFDLPQTNPLLLGETCPKFNFINRKFSDKDAEGYRSMAAETGKQALLISDMRPVDMAAKCATPADVTLHTLFASDKDEMNVQMRWVEKMKPRQALVRFRIPYNETDGELGSRAAPDEPMTITYLKGRMFLQPFSKRTSTEVKLHVDPVNPDTGEYDTKVYSCKDHEECMLYHSAVVRRCHFDGYDTSVARLTRASPVLAAKGIPTQALHTVHRGSGRVSIGYKHSGLNGVELSHDQVLAHAILGKWVDRATTDPDVGLGLDGPSLEEHVSGLLSRIHAVYRKTLSLDLSTRLGHLVAARAQKQQPADAGVWRTIGTRKTHVIATRDRERGERARK